MRPAKPADAAQVIKWSMETQGNEYDPAVITFPTTFTLCAFDKDGPVAYLPVQQPLMMDSLALRPDCDMTTAANAIVQLVQAAILQCSLKGSGELYFLGTNELTNAMAEKHGFEKIPWSVYRLKLADLEK